ncbi:MAG: 3'(2'),5'-bisphosphate nucleotidase CysQ [Acidobacteriota bacterium]
MRNELISLAVMAGDAIREVYESGSWETVLKADNSPLTKADRASHAILFDGLTRIAPRIPVLSEESDEIPFETRKDWDSYFLIDPLDGTREFVARIPEFAINIALISKGHPVMGLIHSPLERTTLFAEKGKGLVKVKDGSTNLSLNANSSSSRTVRVLLSHTDKTAGLGPLLARIPEHSLLRKGSSLKFCDVAEGKADFYPRLKPSMEWDTASGTIVVEESGGFVCDLTGTRIEYNRKDMLNPPFFVIGKTLLEKLPDWEKRFLQI